MAWIPFDQFLYARLAVGSLGLLVFLLRSFLDYRLQSKALDKLDGDRVVQLMAIRAGQYGPEHRSDGTNPQASGKSESA